MGMVGLVVAPVHAHHESLISSGGGEQVIPLLTAANYLVDEADQRPKQSAGIQFWQPQPHSHPVPQNPNPNSYTKKAVPMLDSGTPSCQDCGNQAKKDCVHRRCRTCCKSRGFHCSTHVKSTWVPASRRRERQLSAAGAGSSASTSAPKKPRLVPSHGEGTTTTPTTSTSNTTPPRSFDTSSSHHQDGRSRTESLPGQVQAPAVFKCVRVTSMDDGEDEYAYQAMVRIGGHVFKGFLYDQGIDEGRSIDRTLVDTSDSNNNNNTAGNAIPNISELHLGGGGDGRNQLPPLAATDLYGTAGGLFGGNANYVNSIN